MNSWQHAPLHEVGQPLYVWYVPGIYDGHHSIEELGGMVVGSKWVDSQGRNGPYGWLVLLKLDDGSYRSIYECKCITISRKPTPCLA
jgi:hypothetical protein